ncbi:MAG TPA: hypothetical protein VGP43_06610 [Chitinophagaceae bacterium]|nr:hypothetical protein [Chitinophagaceae bacterium]
MTKIHKAEDLKNAILELEAKKIVAEEAMKRQFHETMLTFKPSNILKNTVSEVAASPQFKHNILNLALGLGAGLITNKIAVGKKAGLLARTVGTALQFGITSLIVKNKANEEKVGQKRGGLFNRIFSRAKT